MTFSPASVLFDIDGYNILSATSEPGNNVRGLVVRSIPSGLQKAIGSRSSGEISVENPVLIAGIDGNMVRTIATDSSGRIITAPAGASSTTSGFAAGYVATTTTSKVSVRNTVYTEPISTSLRSIVSSSASDASAGIGARTVKITYYTQAGVGPQSETLTLTGTVPSNTVSSSIYYIESLEVLTVGSAGSNAGTISLKSAISGGGTTIGSISIGENKAFWGHHYTPAGKTTFITSLSVGHNGTSAGSGATYTLSSKDLSVPNTPENQISDFIRLFGQSSTITRSFGTPIQVVGPARITMYVAPESATNLIFRGAFDFYDQ